MLGYAKGIPLLCLGDVLGCLFVFLESSLTLDSRNIKPKKQSDKETNGLFKFLFSFGMYITKVKQKQINQKGGQQWQIQKIQGFATLQPTLFPLN